MAGWCIGGRPASWPHGRWRTTPDDAPLTRVRDAHAHACASRLIARQVNLPAIVDSLPSLAGWDLPVGPVYEGNTLFVGGGKSRFLRSTHLPAIQQHFSTFSLNTIRTAGHWIHADEPDALLLITENFLNFKVKK